MLGVRWLLIGLLAVWAAPSAAAPPVLSGLYRVGQLGLVEFSSQEGRYVGKFKGQGQCELANDVQVVTGSFEGTVFIGNVLLCQEGPSCEKEKSYPMLGVWHSDSLVGAIKLEVGCRSPGLPNKQLSFSTATQEEKAKVYQGGNSATNVATQKTPKGSDVTELLNDGAKKLDAGDYRAARDSFQRVLAYDDGNFVARAGLGVSQVKLKEYNAAIENLDRALGPAQKARASGEFIAQIHFNIGCAMSQLGRQKEALAALHRAVSTGTASQLLDDLERDEDLSPIRNDAEFRKLVAGVRTQPKKRNPR